MDATSYILLSLVGVVAGVLGGLLGIGGSSVMLPAMVWILGATVGGVEQIHQYMAAAMIVNFLLILPSVAAHVRNGAVWPKVWKVLVASALVGIVVGVQVSYFFDKARAKYLRWFVGVFFVYVVLDNLRRMVKPSLTAGTTRERIEALGAWRKAAVGFPMGVIAGLLGIGGGSLAVPGQQLVLKMPLRNAIANSAATIASVSWLGAIMKNVQLGSHGSAGRSLILATCLAPTAMIGSYVGGHLTHRLPLRIVRTAFIGIMVLAALKMFGWV